LDKLPACIYVVDPKREIACVREANKLSIPIIALIDTDADPDVIDYPVPGNDDAIKSVRYITSSLVEVVKVETQKAQDLVKLVKEEQTDKEPDIEKYETLEEKIIPQDSKKPAPKKKQRKES
jgi:small subunit ribosomal protein S2